MAKAILQSESTLTDRYQTTVPDAVRKALHLDRRDKIRYTVQSDGVVLLSRVETAEEDPAIGKFLSFLAEDIQSNPQHIRAINQDLQHHIQSLIAGVHIELDELLPDEDD